LHLAFVVETNCGCSTPSISKQERAELQEILKNKKYPVRGYIPCMVDNRPDHVLVNGLLVVWLTNGKIRGKFTICRWHVTASKTLAKMIIQDAKERAERIYQDTCPLFNCHSCKKDSDTGILIAPIEKAHYQRGQSIVYCPSCVPEKPLRELYEELTHS
jgi:hypothetical protein